MAALKKFGAVFEALRECACAFERGDLSGADLSMKRALDLAEDDNERLVTYFAQALAQRAYRLLPKYPPDFSNSYLDGGEHFYTSRAAKLIGDIIAKAVLSGKSTIHLIFFSLDWFSQQTLRFMKERLEKVPQMCLKITVVETSNNICTTKEEFFDEFDFLSHTYEGIKFEFNRVGVINQRLDELDVSRLKIDRDDEFVVVNCFFLLGYMLPAALNKFLVLLRNDINPDIFYLVEYDANLNQDEFLMRFDESFWHFSDIYTLIHRYCEYDLVHHLRDEISNVVACEGGERMVRHMTSNQWRDLLNKSGFSSIPVLYGEERIDDDDEDDYDFDFKIENGCMKINGKGQERPLYFLSAWKIKESSFDEDFYHNSLDGDHNFQNLPISPDPQHRSLIRMASLAEIHDMTYQIFKYYHVQEILVWGKCEDNHNDGRSSCLCIVDQIESEVRTNEIPKYHLQERNYVTKTFESNQPCFVPDTTYGEKGLSIYRVDDLVNGAFAIKLNSRHANCEGYVVVFLFDFPYDMVSEKIKKVMDKILCNLRSQKSYFVTCSTLDDFLDKLEATPDAVRIIDNPSVQSQSHNNVMDGNVPLLQLPHQSSTPNAELLNQNEVSDVQEELFLQYGSSTPLARDQNLLVDSSMKDIDLNDEISLDNWEVGDDIVVQVSLWPPHQFDKEHDALKNVPFTHSEASQHPSKPNASEGQRNCVTVELDNAQTTSFVTCPTPSVQSQSHYNVTDGNVPLLQLPRQRSKRASHQNLLDSSTTELLNLNEVNHVQGAFFPPHGSSTPSTNRTTTNIDVNKVSSTPSAKPAKEQNLVASSSRDMDENEVSIKRKRNGVPKAHSTFKKKKSLIWHHVQKEKGEDGKIWVKCNYYHDCGFKREHNSKQGTTVWKNHLERHHNVKLTNVQESSQMTGVEKFKDASCVPTDVDQVIALVSEQRSSPLSPRNGTQRIPISGAKCKEVSPTNDISEDIPEEQSDRENLNGWKFENHEFESCPSENVVFTADDIAADQSLGRMH